MKILLIQPPSCDPLTDKIFLFEPLALEYLGAGLKLDGHEVRLLDARLEPDIDGAFRAFAECLAPLVDAQQGTVYQMERGEISISMGRDYTNIKTFQALDYWKPNK